MSRKQAAIPPTRKMTNATFVRHMNARHLEEEGEIHETHFDMIPGLGPMWRAWHMADHRKFQDELDHYHRED